MSTLNKNMDQLQGKLNNKIFMPLWKNSEIHNFFYSFYVGQKPHIMVTDLDMLKQIMVKDFQNFMDHEVNNIEVIEH